MATDRNADIADIRRRLAEKSDISLKLKLARLLAEDVASRPEAREICFQILAKESENRLSRLLLARLFYLDGLFEFSVRELMELKRQGVSGSLDKLLAAFGHHTEKFSGANVLKESSPEESTVAEVDIDADFLAALDDE